MIDFFRKLFDTADFPQRWFCGNWETGHGWLHIISDLAIFGAYTAIPTTLIIFAWKKHRDILFEKLIWLFAAFIFACGTTHLIEATIFWQPWYRFAGLIKAITAVISWLTVFAVIHRMPLALKMPGMISLNRDLEKTLEEQKKASDDLRRSNHDLDQFAYVASHDMKAPIRAIRTLASWIEEDCADILPDDSRKHILQLHQRVDRLDTLVADLLRYSRCDQDLAEPEEVDLGKLVREVFEDRNREETGFELKIDGKLPTVRTWRVPLEQIIRNLIGNAMKHHGSDTGLIEAGAVSRANSVTLRISDDGPGIPKEFHERIFQMFQTLKPKDEVEGSGMGLAIVEKLVKRIGGTISLESAEGEGTSFYIKLPKTPPVE